MSSSSSETYQEIASRHRRSKPIAQNVGRAFLMGGVICIVGQLVTQFFLAHGFSIKKAPAPTSVIMIGLGALLTGLGWYDSVVAWAGMGGSLPITGFANTIVAPAMEYKREGFVLGVGAKMFTVAGPVLAYGLAAAFIVGFVRLILGFTP